MKIGFVGSRTASKASIDRVFKYLDSLEDIEAIVTGGALGADTWAMRYAYKHNIKLIVYKPNKFHNYQACDWCQEHYDKATINATGLGYLDRNTLIVNDSDIIVSADYGNGTIDTMQKAINQGKKVLVFGKYIRGATSKTTPYGVEFK